MQDSPGMVSLRVSCGSWPDKTWIIARQAGGLKVIPEELSINHTMILAIQTALVDE